MILCLVPSNATYVLTSTKIVFLLWKAKNPDEILFFQYWCVWLFIRMFLFCWIETELPFLSCLIVRKSTKRRMKALFYGRKGPDWAQWWILTALTHLLKLFFSYTNCFVDSGEQVYHAGRVATGPSRCERQRAVYDLWLGKYLQKRVQTSWRTTVRGPTCVKNWHL